VIVDGSGVDLGYPQGDPGGITAAAGRLDSVAGRLSSGAGQVGNAAASAGGDWTGPASLAFEAGAGSVRSGLNGLAGHITDAATALSTYAQALTEAQKAASLAATAYNQAEAKCTDTLRQLEYNPPKGSGATAIASRIESGAISSLQSSYTTNSIAATSACTDARNAARSCAAKLSAIAEDIKATALHKFLDLMGGPATVFGVLGLESQVGSGARLWNLMQAMNKGDWETLAKVDPKAYASVLEAAEKYGPDSMQALVAQLRYEETIGGDAFGEFEAAAVPAASIPAGRLAASLDVLGKMGLVLAVVGDVGTFVDGQASGMDKGMAGANLAGTVAVGADMAADAAVNAGIISVNAIGDEIPVAGEVIIAATAVYFAQEWVRTHWGDITHWGDDVGHFAGTLATGAWNDGKKLLSDLNPF
jgi:hypothetical protein